MQHTSYSASADHDAHLPAWAYTALALLAVVAGLVAAAITTQFFTLGLSRTEADPLARQALVMAGVLMVAVEVAAFGVAALLPRRLLRSARVTLLSLGLALLAFEAVTLYVTQVALVRAAQASHQGQATRVAELSASIASQRATVATLRETAAHHAASRHSWVRESGATVARQALAAESRLLAQADELAQLEAAAVPTLTDTLGEAGMIAYAVARSLLVVLMGVVLFGVAGALLRVRRGLSPAAAPAAVAAAPLPAPTSASKAPAMKSLGGRYAAPLAASLVAPAIAAPVPAIIAPAAAAAPSAARTLQPAAAAEKNPPKRRATVRSAAVRDTGTSADDGARFERVRAAILAGTVKPSLRAIWQVERASQRVASRYLAAMEAAGELKRHGQGYVLA